MKSQTQTCENIQFVLKLTTQRSGSSDSELIMSKQLLQNECDELSAIFELQPNHTLILPNLYGLSL